MILKIIHQTYLNASGQAESWGVIVDRYMKHTRNYWSPIRYEESRGKI